jgi:hypothetical protein
MYDFAIGLLAGISFCSGPMVFFFIGWKRNKKGLVHHEPKFTDHEKEEQRRVKEHRKAFINTMNYDVEKAVQRKKVT